MKGLIRLCDLSPNGDKLIYWAAQYHFTARWQRYRSVHGVRGNYDSMLGDSRLVQKLLRRRPSRKPPRYLATHPTTTPPRQIQGVWTAVSTPPYFTALAIWPSFGHWTGGGYFASERRIVLYEPQSGLNPIENMRIPADVTISSWTNSGVLDWIPSTLAFDPRRKPTEQQHAMEQALRAAGATFVDWTHIADNGDALFACDGSIYRHPRWRENSAAELLAGARRLIDLSSHRFELVGAPASALRW